LQQHFRRSPTRQSAQTHSKEAKNIWNKFYKQLVHVKMYRHDGLSHTESPDLVRYLVK